MIGFSLKSAGSRNVAAKAASFGALTLIGSL